MIQYSRYAKTYTQRVIYLDSQQHRDVDLHHRHALEAPLDPRFFAFENNYRFATSDASQIMIWQLPGSYTILQTYHRNKGRTENCLWNQKCKAAKPFLPQSCTDYKSPSLHKFRNILIRSRSCVVQTFSASSLNV